MPRPRLAMRNVREVLRLSLDQGLSVRDVAASLGVARSTVSDHLRRSEKAGLSWPLPDDLSDSALEQLLFPRPSPASASRPLPDWKEVHKELRLSFASLMGPPRCQKHGTTSRPLRPAETMISVGDR